MVGSNLKAEAKALMDKREAMEVQIEAISSRLTAPGAPGVRGSLIDKDGFPRADIDIPAIRCDRNRLAVLHNDHKELTVKIERIILELHSQSQPSNFSPSPRAGNSRPMETSRDVFRPSPPPPLSPPVGQISASTSQSQPDPQPMEESKPSISSYLRPYAVIDELAEHSPAQEDGIRLGDLLLSFGPVVAGEECMGLVAQHLQRSEGRRVEVRVLREGRETLLEVTPRAWAGRGFLGCHLRPLLNR